MVTLAFRDHLHRLHTAYRGMVEANHLQELDRVMARGEWVPNGINVAPVAPIISSMTSDIMDELHGAAANRDKRAARHALLRLRGWIAKVAA